MPPVRHASAPGSPEPWIVFHFLTEAWKPFSREDRAMICLRGRCWLPQSDSAPR
jgi:hypothetical protein